MRSLSQLRKGEGLGNRSRYRGTVFKCRMTEKQNKDLDTLLDQAQEEHFRDFGEIVIDLAFSSFLLLPFPSLADLA